MNPRLHNPEKSGIAMIIVMLVIVVLSVMAGGFAYTMKVETRLAANSAYESDMEWLGRSGVEMARYVLGQQLGIPGDASYTGLNQFWASGDPGTNEVFADIDLKNTTLGSGHFSIEITDMERRFNLSLVNEANIAILEKALVMSGVDSGDISGLLDCYLDWIDPDEQKRLHGAESRDYMRDPLRPHYAKNGPVDDIAELTMIKGFGPGLVFRNPLMATQSGVSRAASDDDVERSGGPALEQLFSPIGGAGMAVNVNTASAEVLQLIPGIDPETAQGIVATRQDLPFMNLGELQNVPGIDPAALAAAGRFLTVQSFIFEVTVHAEIGSSKRTYKALVHRRGRGDVPILYFSWK